MILREILRVKGTDVHTIEPNATLLTVAHRLVEHHCGSLLVCDSRLPRRVLGIITERDLLRATAAHSGAVEGLTVADHMTSLLVTGHPNDTIDEVMGLMTQHRIRHMPVMDGDELVGLVSIGDVVKAHHDAMVQENHLLRVYIQS